MTITSGVVHLAVDRARCPMSDDDTDRCTSPATELVRLSAQAYVKVCHFHAYVIEGD